jgi:TPR repeat protein
MRIQIKINAAAVLAALLLALTAPALAQTSITRDLNPEQKDLESVTVPKSNLTVTAWVDKADGNYKPGEALQLFVKTNQDAYVTVVDIGSSGRPLIIFPNKFQTDTRILAHQVVQVPGVDADWRLKVTGPAGLEYIKVFASTSPEPVISPEQLIALGPVNAYRGTAKTLTRDLNIELNQRRTDDRATTDRVIRILEENGAMGQPPGPGATKVAGPGFPQPPAAAKLPTPPAVTADPPAAAPAKVSAVDLFKLGEASFYGDGGQSDHRMALKHLTAAADAGHIGAMHLIARIHEQGQDVDQSTPKATEWYRRAADLGHPQAMVKLAILSVKASGGRDKTEALMWLKKAASQGDGMAMLHLAKMHDDGIGTDRAPKDAARYLLAALKTGAWTVIDQLAKFNEDTRKEVQSQLKAAGHYKGVGDGKVGAETRAAMVEWAKPGA